MPNDFKPNRMAALEQGPEAKRRKANALMAAQFDRPVSQDTFAQPMAPGTEVAERSFFLPLGTYSDGRTGIAWPGIVTEPAAAWSGLVNRAMNTGYVSGDTQNVEDAFNVSGAAMVGGLAAPRPRGAVAPKAIPESTFAQRQAQRDMEWQNITQAEQQAYNDISRNSRGPITEQGWHGSRNSRLLTDGPRSKDDGGPWGTNTRDIANSYARYEGDGGPSITPDGAMVMPAEYRFNRPFVYDAKGQPWSELNLLPERFNIVHETDDLAGAAKMRGHDGLVVRNVDDLQEGTGGPISTVYKPLQPGTVYSPLTGELLYSGGGRPGAAVGAGLSAAGERQGIRAYHGSPHDFDRFDMSKIGTGEGAQAYGHGLYFAENEAVAKSYREGLAAAGSRPPFVDGRVFDPTNPLHVAAVWSEGRTSRQAIDDINRYPTGQSYFDLKIGDDTLQSAKQVLERGDRLPALSVNDGRLYEVRINANPDDFLDWDKPLSQQSEKVRGALQELGADKAVPGGVIPQANVLATGYSDPGSGGAMVQALRDHYGRTTGLGSFVPRVEDKLKERGIPGIKYLDQGSRTAGEGSRNYVVFDDNLVEILRKYGLLGMIGGGAVAAGAEADRKPQSDWASRMQPGDA